MTKKEVTSKRLDIALEGDVLVFSFKGNVSQNIYMIHKETIMAVHVLNSDQETEIEVIVDLGNENHNYSFEVTDMKQEELNEVVKFLQGFIAYL